MLSKFTVPGFYLTPRSFRGFFCPATENSVMMASATADQPSTVYGHHTPYEPLYPAFTQSRSSLLASVPRRISPESEMPGEKIRNPPPGFENSIPESYPIRIRKLPPNITERDIRNILLFAKDLQEVRLTDGNRTAFALFGSQQSAIQAQDCLNGKSIDPLESNVLSVELLDKNEPLSLDSTPLSAGNSSPTSDSLSNGYTTRPPYPRTAGVSLMNGTNGVSGATGINGIGITSGISQISLDNGNYYEQSFLQQLPYHRNGPFSTDGELDGDDLRVLGSRNRAMTNPPINAPSRIPHLPQLTTTNVGTSFMSPSHHIASPIGMNSPSTWHTNNNHTLHPRNLPAANPADQNPPCNTLYVGNLPVNTTEDELKNLFSRQRGYKRLMLKPKPQGPMCFVEFEDIDFATKALADLYGRNLSNSVKGGIRLSFSKNPLGVRSPSNVHTPTPLTPGTPVGNNMGSTQFPFTTASHNPPGLPTPASRQPISLSPAAYDQHTSSFGVGFGNVPNGGYYSHGR